MNDRLLQALKGSNRSRPPIWIMRQAGRYLPEYRSIRAKHSFIDMCHQPELIAEITQLPLKILGLDAAILFSDILVIVEGLGLGFHVEEGVGPIIDRKIQTVKDVEGLADHNVEDRLGYVAQGIKFLKSQLDVPLIGFCGGPFTVASYLVEDTRDFKKTKQWMLRDPKGFHQLLEKICQRSIEYLNMQIDAGVDAIQIFDTWAGVLGHVQFREFSLRYLEKMVSGVKKRGIPVILFCRGSSVFAKQFEEIEPAGLSLDWNCDLLQMRKWISPKIALQGNLDPFVLYAGKEVIVREVNRLVQGMAGDMSYIFNLGHGIFPDVSVDNVKFLVECVKNR